MPDGQERRQLPRWPLRSSPALKRLLKVVRCLLDAASKRHHGLPDRWIKVCIAERQLQFHNLVSDLRNMCLQLRKRYLRAILKTIEERCGRTHLAPQFYEFVMHLLDALFQVFRCNLRLRSLLELKHAAILLFVRSHARDLYNQWMFCKRQ